MPRSLRGIFLFHHKVVYYLFLLKIYLVMKIPWLSPFPALSTALVTKASSQPSVIIVFIFDSMIASFAAMF